MVRRPHSRRVIVATFLMGATFAVGHAQEQPAATGASRFKVLVPTLVPQAGAKPNFGKDVAEEVRKLILRMPRHEPVDKKEVAEAFRKYGLKEGDMDCIKNMQLALNLGAKLVMCGWFSGAAPSFTVDSVQFISTETNEAFTVSQITSPTPKDAAAQVFAKFEQFIGNLESITFCYGYIESQDWVRALENCERALSLNPKSVKGMMGKAFIYLQQAGTGEQTDTGKLTEALALYEKVLAENPLEQDAMRTAGIIAARLGQNEKSRDLFKRYLELNPGDIAVRGAIAGEQQKAGDPEGALRVIEEGIKTDTTKNTDLLFYAGVYAAQAGYKAQLAAAKANPNLTALPPEAKTLYETAYDYYKRLFDIKNGDIEPAVAEQMLTTLAVLGRFQDAVDIGVKLVGTKAATAKVWAAYAAALANVGKTQEAIIAFDSAIARNDTSATGLRARKADIILRSGDLVASKAALQAAIAAGEKTGDEVSNLIWSIGVNEKFQKNPPDYEGFLTYIDAARDFAQSSLEKSKLSFWAGLSIYTRIARGTAPTTAAPARALLPQLQRAVKSLEEGEEYGRSKPEFDYQKTLKGVRDYIDYLNQVIKRG